MLKGKKVTVGVTGGIAAYKAAEIVSWLSQQQADVQVVMSEGATRFVSELTMKTLSRRPVAVDIMSTDPAFHVPHIDVAAADLFVIVPATANLLAKAAIGLADDLLSAALLATTAPIIACPAMNVHMYENPATQANLVTLRQRGWTMVEPGYGMLACGVEGRGRLAEPEQIKQAVVDALCGEQLLAGLKVLVTAGPTYEYIDPVRFIGNRSSGKMGYALAAAARQAGAEVRLVAGPVSLADPPGIAVQHVVSAEEMQQAVRAAYADCDIVIMAAAVADYRPATIEEQKMKKGGDQQLTLVRTPDILAGLGAEKGDRFLVGFAAETNDLAAYAGAKLRQKNLDLIVANNVAQPGAGFDGDTNIITLMWPDGEGIGQRELPLQSKTAAAREVIAQIALLQAK